MQIRIQTSFSTLVRRYKLNFYKQVVFDWDIYIDLDIDKKKTALVGYF